MILQTLIAAFLAQTLPPNLPPGMTLPPGFTMPPMNSGRRGARNKRNEPPSTVKPAGVPISLDSPPIKSFQQLEGHSYHTRMTLTAPDPSMQQMMEQMGLAPMETTVSGGRKLAVMRMRMPAGDIPGQWDDWEFKSVSEGNRVGSLISSPASARILKMADEKLAKQIVEIEKMAAKTMAQSLAQGPVGWARAAMAGAEAAVDTAQVISIGKKAHDMFEWQCKSVNRPEVDKTAPPPLTDLQAVGDQTLDGVPVTTYEFFVQEKGQFHGPMRMHIARDTGLPFRIEMSDPQMRGAKMQMDYFDIDENADIEAPGCLAGRK